MADYREIFEKIPDGVTLHDAADGTILDSNQQFCEMLGYTREELLALDFDALHVDEPPYTSERAEEYIRKAATEGPQTFEWVDETKAGERLPVEVNLRLTTLDDGDRILAVVRDISERKRREAELEALHDRIELALEETNSHIFAVDLDTGTVERHGPTASLFGVPTDEMDDVNSFLEKAVHPEDRPELEERFAAVWDGESEGFAVEFRTHPSATDVRWIRSEVKLEADDDARRMIGIAIDITEQKERERTLETLHDATREMMRTDSTETIADVASRTAIDVLDLPVNGVHLYDEAEEGLVPVATSPANQEILGTVPTFRPSESLAWGVYESGEPEIHKDLRAPSDLYNPETPIRSEMVLPLGEHGVFIVSSTDVDDFDDADIALAQVLTANLETALDRAERESNLEQRTRELARQNDRLDEFASVVSHDLRNPLNVADGRLELAREECDSEHLDDVARAHDRIQTLVDDLLALAREGKRAKDTEAVDLAKITENCWRNVDTAGAALAIETTRTVQADQSRLQQLLENLMRNAVEHGGDVTVTIGDLDAGFYVADDGPGISEDQRSRVFESGYSTAREGTGFGLSIVQEIAEAHDWEIRVTDSEDGGARFEITGVESAQ